MSYYVEIKLNKKISRDELKNTILSEFPKWALPFGISDQSWGFSCYMDVFADRNDAPSSKITLHAAYGIDYGEFTFCMIEHLCKHGYRICSLKYVDQFPNKDIQLYGCSFDDLAYLEEPHQDRESLRYRAYMEWQSRIRKDKNNAT